MGNWRDAFPSKWIKHTDVEDGPKLLTIKEVTMEDVSGSGEMRPVVWFQELEKGLGLNITNGNSIEKIAKSADPDNWPGTVVVLFRSETDFKGERVPCVRVRAPKPGAKKPEPPPDDFDDESVPF